MRNRNHGFDVNVTYQGPDDEDGITIRVVGNISDYVPAVYHLPNGDPGYPAEGGEIEDYKIFGTNGKEIEDPDGDILDSVMDDVLESISEDAAADQYDAAEHRREAMEDR